jgi:hypothetical protein
VIVPALVTLAASMIFMGDLDEGERWLQGADRVLRTDTGSHARSPSPSRTGPSCRS